MLKIVGCIFIVGITGMIGWHFSTELYKRRVTLSTLSYMLDEISMLIRYRCSDVFEIINCLSENERFDNLQFIQTAKKQYHSNITFTKLWIEAVEKTPVSCLNKSDIEFIKGIGKGLGKSDVEGQISFLELQKAELNIIIQNAENEYNSKAKLYRTLGFLTGAFIVICIL